MMKYTELALFVLIAVWGVVWGGITLAQRSGPRYQHLELNNATMGPKNGCRASPSFYHSRNIQECHMGDGVICYVSKGMARIGLRQTETTFDYSMSCVQVSK